MDVRNEKSTFSRIDLEAPAASYRNRISSAPTSRSSTPVGGSRGPSPPLRVGSKSGRQGRRPYLYLGLLAILGLVIYSATSLSTPEQKDQLVQSQHALSGYINTYLAAPFTSAERSAVLHPILTLLQRARERHTTLINRQSQSLAQAKSTYRTRYGKEAPVGFEQWYAFAEARNHTLVDEYDQLMVDLQPFAALSPSTLRQRTKTLSQLPGVSIVSIKDGKSQVNSKSGRWAPALAFEEMIQAFVKDLPDMDIAINERLEGRILPEIRQTVQLAEWGIVEDDVEKSACFSICLQNVMLRKNR